MSDPNSQHQRWSKWTWTITPGRTLNRPFVDVQTNLARAFRTVESLRSFFRSGAQMKLEATATGYQLQVLAEGIDAQDPFVVDWIKTQVTVLFTKGFGMGTEIEQSVKWMAGDKEDGLPRDQMLIMPFIVDTHVWELARELHERNQSLGMPNIYDTRLWGK